MEETIKFVGQKLTFYSVWITFATKGCVNFNKFIKCRYNYSRMLHIWVLFLPIKIGTRAAVGIFFITAQRLWLRERALRHALHRGRRVRWWITAGRRLMSSEDIHQQSHTIPSASAPPEAQTRRFLIKPRTQSLLNIWERPLGYASFFLAFAALIFSSPGTQGYRFQIKILIFHWFHLWKFEGGSNKCWSNHQASLSAIYANWWNSFLTPYTI